MVVTYLSGQRIQGSSTADAIKGADFDGSSSYSEFGSASDWTFLSNGTGMTMSMWMKTADLSASQQILVTMNNQSGNNTGTAFGVDSDGGKFVASCYQGDASAGYPIGMVYAIGDTDWHHWVVTTNSAGTENKMYRDGVEVVTESWSGTWSASSPDHTLTAGKRDNDQQYFDGSFTQVLLFKRELTQANVTTLYNSGKPLADISSVDTDLFAYYKCDGNMNDSEGSINGSNNDITFSTAFSTDEKTTVTDVPVGSEFEQTDNYKTYQMAESLVDGADLKCYIKFNDVDTTDPLVNTASSVTGNGSDTLGTDADMILGGAVDPTYAVTAPTDLGTGAMKFFETAGDGTVGSWGNLGTSASQWKFLHYNSANTSNFPKWTICFWCKMGSDSTNNKNIIRNVSGDSTAGITIYHYDGDVGAGNGGLGVMLSSDDGSAGQVPLAFFSASEFFQYDDAWHFYAFTMDFSLSSATLKMWRDMGTTTPAYQTADKGAGALESGNPTYALGFRHYTASGVSSNTYIPPTASYCELSIWDRVLTDAELDKIYNSGAGMDLVTGAKIWVERGTAI